jgi:NitT/TauT family transport system substrate-binding protein
LAGAKPLCEDLPAEVPKAPADTRGWGVLFDGNDCEAGYALGTWDLFSKTYLKAGVIQKGIPAADGFDTSILEGLGADKYQEKYNSNQWIGRVGL